MLNKQNKIHNCIYSWRFNCEKQMREKGQEALAHHLDPLPSVLMGVCQMSAAKMVKQVESTFSLGTPCTVQETSS